MIIDSTKYTCVGGYKQNEDSLLCSDENGIYAVADGLGGHADGEKASAAAINYLSLNCRGGYTDKRIRELLENTNRAVITAEGQGCTTLAAAFTEKGVLRYANIGDSRVYVFRKGKIIAQTKDHSVCQAMVDMGSLKPEEIRFNDNRSALLKVLGKEEDLALGKDYPAIKLRDGDAFLVCSDGFWEYVLEKEMQEDLKRSANSWDWLHYMLERHLERAENKGDNYTAICGIARLPKDKPTSFKLWAG